MTEPAAPAPPAPVRFPERILGEHRARWLATVDEGYAAMEHCIDAATHSVRLETYILNEPGPAVWLGAALLRARSRGVAVSVLVDAFGSENLRDSYLQSLRDAGVRVGVFNPKRLLRLSFRNHRKLLVCDGTQAIVGGFNIAPEYAGDGVQSGWCDTGVFISGPVAKSLEESFDALFKLAPFMALVIRPFRRQMHRLWHLRTGRLPVAPRVDAAVYLLQSGPGLPRAPMRRAFRHDLRRAQDVSIASGYFLPSLRIRRLLYRVSQGTGRVRVLLAGRSDVPLARLAAERLYGRLFHRRVQLHEYQPQILHAKLVVMDDVVYVGSCNLDRRSLHINYELLLRLHWPELASDAKAWFEQALAFSHKVDGATMRARRGFWRRALTRFAYLLLARVDPLLARRRFRAIS